MARFLKKIKVWFIMKKVKKQLKKPTKYVY